MVYSVKCRWLFIIWYRFGIYATPSTDTAAPDDKVGVASGVYKMASSLGNAFGVAISSTVYSVLAAQLNLTLVVLLE